MEKEITQNIIEAIEQIPGIIGFVELDLESNIKIENENDYYKAISVEINKDTKTVLINISIIISLLIAIENISNQVKESVNFILKKRNLKLENINVFIKGVK
ncbi:MAG: Asp23/Gls24 family envelope stress response protein [Metamycoplasmataceae bacterium]